jgi:hypothetical protein
MSRKGFEMGEMKRLFIAYKGFAVQGQPVSELEAIGSRYDEIERGGVSFARESSFVREMEGNCTL